MQGNSQRTSLPQTVFALLTAVVLSAMVRKLQKNENIEDQLVFYASYHQNPVNVAIHIVFIPLIWWTIVIMAAHYRFLGLELYLPGTRHRITWATSIFAQYSIYYVMLDQVTGAVATMVMFFMYSVACMLADPSVEEKGYRGRVLQIAMCMQVLAWYMQIHPGHMIFEGVKPALCDSMGDALTVAPFFSLYDALWLLFPSSSPDSLQARVISGVVKRRVEMCTLDATLPFCTS
jgi:uncharacterized membrane protein YGL010W